MSPKSLLRHPQAVSPLSAFSQGAFRDFLPDEEADPAAVTRVLLCSGKIYYELLAARREQEARQVAIVRLEQLYPLDAGALLGILSRYREGVEVVWVQEEPRNMGAWDFVNLHLSPLLRGWSEFSCISRPAIGQPRGRIGHPASAGAGRAREPGDRRARARSGGLNGARRRRRGGREMAIGLRVPALGESITQATLGAWLKKEGDRVEADEPLVEVESEKATVALPAPAAGVLRRILKPSGANVAVGEVIGEEA
jgi:hypothetical protein